MQRNQPVNTNPNTPERPVCEKREIYASSTPDQMWHDSNEMGLAMET